MMMLDRKDVVIGDAIFGYDTPFYVTAVNDEILFTQAVCSRVMILDTGGSPVMVEEMPIAY